MIPDIQTATIVLSSDPARVQGIIDGTISLTSDNSHDIVLYSDHTNFISLTHQFNYSNGSNDAKYPMINIELIDPDNKFNERFIFASLGKILTGKRTVEFDVANKNFNDLMEVQERAKKLGEFGYIQSLTDISTTLSSLPYDPSFADTMNIGAEILKAESKTIFNKGILGIFSSEDTKKVFEDNLLKRVNEVAADQKKQRDILLAKNAELKAKVDGQIAEIKKQLSNPVIYILYGIGNDLTSWAGPFICRLNGVDYKFVGSNGARSISLSFVPMGDITIFTGDNVLANGIGVLNSSTAQDDLPVKVKIFEEGKELLSFKADKNDPDDARLLRIFRDRKISVDKDVDKIVNKLIFNYIKNALTDTDLLVILPNINQVVDTQLTFLQSVADNFLYKKYWGSYKDRGPESFIDAYAYIELYKSLGFDLTKYGTLHKDKFESSPIPEKLLENFDKFLKGGYRYSETAISLLKLPSETYKEPLDKLTKNLSENGRPIDFEMEVIHDMVYLKKLAKYLRSKGVDLVSGYRPLLVVGDRAMIEKFLYGKKSLETEGILKYVGSPNASGTKSLEDYLTKSTEVFNTPEYQSLARDTFLSFPSSPYNFFKLPTDQFYFKDSAKANNILSSTGTTIFTMGTEESNILDFTSNINLSYYQALQQIWFSEVRGGRYNSGSKDSTPNVSPNNVGKQEAKDALTAISVQDITALADKINQNKDMLAQELNVSNQDLDSITSFLINLLSASKEGRSLNIPVDWASGDDAFQQLVKLITTISRYSNQSTVKTLPAFHLSKSILSLPTVLMILKEPGIINRSNDYSVLTAMSGFWRVLGFQHRISAYDISSSFQLMKDMNSGLPILNSLPTKNNV